jgi:hypothetical protein
MVVASDKGELPPGVHWALWSFALLWLVAAPGQPGLGGG